MWREEKGWKRQKQKQKRRRIVLIFAPNSKIGKEMEERRKKKTEKIRFSFFLSFFLSVCLSVCLSLVALLCECVCVRERENLLTNPPTPTTPGRHRRRPPTLPLLLLLLPSMNPLWTRTQRAVPSLKPSVSLSLFLPRCPWYLSYLVFKPRQTGSSSSNSSGGGSNNNNSSSTSSSSNKCKEKPVVKGSEWKETKERG